MGGADVDGSRQRWDCGSSEPSLPICLPLLGGVRIVVVEQLRHGWPRRRRRVRRGEGRVAVERRAIGGRGVAGVLDPDHRLRQPGESGIAIGERIRRGASPRISEVSATTVAANSEAAPNASGHDRDITASKAVWRCHPHSAVREREMG